MGFNPALNCPQINKWWAELWWKRVPDGWGCNMETPSAEPCCRSGVLPNEDLPDQKCRRLGCRRWSRQDCAHRHSQTQRLLFWTVFTTAMAANEECHAKGRRSEPSQVDGWLMKRSRKRVRNSQSTRVNSQTTTITTRFWQKIDCDLERSAFKQTCYYPNYNGGQSFGLDTKKTSCIYHFYSSHLHATHPRQEKYKPLSIMHLSMHQTPQRQYGNW